MSTVLKLMILDYLIKASVREFEYEYVLSIIMYAKNVVFYELYGFDRRLKRTTLFILLNSMSRIESDVKPK